METMVIDNNMRYYWEKYVDSNPYAIAWQSFKWKDVLRKHYSFQFFPIAALDKKKICGVLPLYLMELSKGRKTMISVPHAVAGGIVANDDTTRLKLLERAIDLCKHHSAQKLVLKQYKVKIPGDLSADENYYNRELRLINNIDKLWKSISNTNRSKIMESEQYNLTIDYSLNNIDIFYKILQKFHHDSGIPCVSKKWITSLVKSGMYKFVLLSRDGKPVVGTMIKEFKTTISFPFSCLYQQDSLHNLYMYNLYWNLINKYAKENYKIFHSGRIPATEETYQFRLGWGGEKHQYYYQYYPSSVTQGEFTRKRSNKRKVFQKIWSLSPRPITNALGPYIVKQFP